VLRLAIVGLALLAGVNSAYAHNDRDSRTTQVYMFRGILSFFSYGQDGMAEDLKKRGIKTHNLVVFLLPSPAK